MKKSFTKTISTSFNVLLIATCIVFVFSPSKTWAQKCKPDYSKMDKIEKKQIDQWSSELYETGAGARITSTSSVSITLNIGRADTLNYVEIQLVKVESSDRNAGLESSIKGAKGNEFHLGLKDGEPLKFVTTEAVNRTQRLALSGSLATIVTLTSVMANEDLQKIKEVLTGKIIDAVRVKLENGLIINQDVKEKNGDRAKNKSVCYFKFLQEAGYMK